MLPAAGQVSAWWKTVNDARVDWQGPVTRRPYPRNARQRFVIDERDARAWQTAGEMGIEGEDVKPPWVS